MHIDSNIVAPTSGGGAPTAMKASVGKGWERSKKSGVGAWCDTNRMLCLACP